MKLKMERQSVYEEMARLTGKPLEDHEGYMRENNGDWIITNENGDRVCTVTFQGKAKRGEAWHSPDPIGQRTARTIVERWNNGERD